MSLGIISSWARIPKIISISCDLNTFLKDTEILLKKSYKLLDKITFEGMYYRKDIGFRVMK